MGIFLIILIIGFVAWPLIRKWIGQFLANRTEDYLRKATGMPPRPGSREGRSAYSRNTRSKRRTNHDRKEPLIPPEYAEDVEFVEVKNFSETTIGGSREETREYHESQVTDVEWVDIKKKS